MLRIDAAMTEWEGSRFLNRTFAEPDSSEHGFAMTLRG